MSLTSLRDLVELADRSVDRSAPVGMTMQGGRPAATLPQAIAIAAELPEPLWPRRDMPVGWGVFPPLDVPIVVTLTTKHRSNDPERQWVAKGAEGWIVCMWNCGGSARLRIGFKPAEASTSARWVDVDHSQLATVPALRGVPMSFTGWTVARLEGPHGY